VFKQLASHRLQEPKLNQPMTTSSNSINNSINSNTRNNRRTHRLTNSPPILKPPINNRTLLVGSLFRLNDQLIF